MSLRLANSSLASVHSPEQLVPINSLLSSVGVKPQPMELFFSVLLSFGQSYFARDDLE